MYSKVFSSGAIRPARAPPSIVMLQTVMRPSIDSARIASPANSMTWPVPPAVPISPMMARMMSLAVTCGRKQAVDTHQHVLGLLLDQRLGRQHMLDLGGADAVRQRAEGAMRRGVAVAADDGHARQREALFRTDDVDDALALVACRIIFDAEFGGIGGQRFHLDAAFLVLDAEMAVGRGRHIVVDDGERLFRRADLTAGHAQAFERLRAGDFVDQVAVDIEKTGAVGLFVDEMVVPDLVVEGTRCAHGVKSVFLKAFGKSRNGRSGSAGRHSINEVGC